MAWLSYKWYFHTRKITCGDISCRLDLKIIECNLSLAHSSYHKELPDQIHITNGQLSSCHIIHSQSLNQRTPPLSQILQPNDLPAPMTSPYREFRVRDNPTPESRRSRAPFTAPSKSSVPVRFVTSSPDSKDDVVRLQPPTSRQSSTLSSTQPGRLSVSECDVREKSPFNVEPIKMGKNFTAASIPVNKLMKETLMKDCSGQCATRCYVIEGSQCWCQRRHYIAKSAEG